MGFISNFVKALFGTPAQPVESQPQLLLKASKAIPLPAITPVVEVDEPVIEVDEPVIEPVIEVDEPVIEPVIEVDEPVIEPEVKPVTNRIWFWESGAVAAPEATVDYLLANPTAGNNTATKTKKGRSRVGVEGGALVGPGKSSAGKALNPTLSGFVAAAKGSFKTALLGRGIRGHRMPDGTKLRFAIDTFLTEETFAKLATALTKTANGRFQIVVTCVHTGYGPKSEYRAVSAKFNHEWRDSQYGNFTVLTVPVEVLSIEVIGVGDHRWVTPVVEGLNLDGFFGTVEEPTAADKKREKKAHDARLKGLRQAFDSFEAFSESVSPAPVRTSLAGVGDASSKFELKKPEPVPANTEDDDDGGALDV